MLPIILCSIIALGIIVERFWSLQGKKIIPPDLIKPSAPIWKIAKTDQFDDASLHNLKNSSPLGEILAAGLINSHHGRDIMKESIEDAGRQVTHELDRFLNTLGTITAISPLLGLLGTVDGMIKVFNTIMTQGSGNPAILAGGISEALITTAAGLIVAIPCLAFHRYFEGLVDEHVLNLEAQALKLIDVMHGDRE
ncbi:MAG: MotA/TolQ/ExbB proton channel family protein [Methylococcaceae bacterium]|nr:MotA/TolQ/ExbB proton channel family protein [Methylococcaceae bacterium]